MLSTLQGTHKVYVHELEEQALDAENKSHQDFLSAHQAVLRHAPQSLREDLHSSYHILLGQSSSSLQSIPFARAPQAQGQPPVTTSPKPECQWSPQPKRHHSLTDVQGDMSIDESFPHGLAGRTIKLQEREDYWLVFLSKAQSCRHLQPGLRSCKRGQRMLLHYSPLGLGPCSNTDRSLWHFQGTCPRCWLAGWVHPQNTSIME